MVIVEHYTASNSFSSAWNTFASNAPDAELHERPGTCAHFVIDRDGTIYQLVPLNTMCRHTVGLNWTAIGIEHVGTSDASILQNPKQIAASLRLTLWLMDRFGISLPNVIGHNESLTSRFHRERYAPWRCQTHGDWVRADMQVYRARLAGLARAEHVRVLRTGGPVATRC
jgi:beta-N-acetylhexosaminidase